MQGTCKRCHAAGPIASTGLCWSCVDVVDVQAATDHYIGWCLDCQEHRMSSQCRQVERTSVTQVSPDVQQEYTHYWVCATCGAAIHELPPF